MARSAETQRNLWAVAGIGLALAGRELFQRWRETSLSGQVALVTGGSRGWAY